jgi:hypothetical protein
MGRDIEALKTGTGLYATPEDTRDSQDTQVAQHSQDTKRLLPEGDIKAKQADPGSPKANRPKKSPSQRATPNKEQGSVPARAFSQLFSWKSALQSIQGGVRPALESELSLPPLPIDAYISHGQSDTWTRTGWTKAHIRHLFDALFTWDYLPVSLLYHDEFLQDFYNDSNRFCSSALVYAMLAVASRVINENHDDSHLLPSGWFGSRVFFDEAEALLQKPGQGDSLPDRATVCRTGRQSARHSSSGGPLTLQTSLWL